MKNYQLIHPLDPKKDNGRDIALVFNLGTIKSKKYGEAHNINGHFLCMLPYGLFPQISPERLEEVDKNIIDLAINLGLIKKGDNYYNKFSKIGVGKAVILFSPDIDNIKLTSYFYTFFFFIDDLISSFKLFNRNTVYPTCRQLKEVMEEFTAVMRGHYTHLDAIPHLDFPLFKPLCATLIAMRQEALLSKADITYFVEEVVRFFRAIVWERAHIEQNKKKNYKEEELFFFRHWSVAVHPTIEAINLAKDTRLSEDIRKHPIYERVLYQVCIHIVLMNDVLSLKKELLDDEYQTDNQILIKLRKYSLHESIAQVIKKANSFMLDLKKNILSLKNCFPNDINLHRFIESVNYVIDGNIYWHQQSQRYDFNYDYYTIEYSRRKNYDAISQEVEQQIQPAIEKSFYYKKTRNPIKNGLQFLEHTCSVTSSFQSRIGNSRELANAVFCPYIEVYSSAILLDLLENLPVNIKLLSFLKNFLIEQYDRETFNFFTQRGILPDDVDDTALCALALFRNTPIIDIESLKLISKRVIANVNEKGIIQVYFPPRGERENRIDPIVCANAMRLIYQAKLDTIANETEIYIYQVLESKSYLEGSWFYHSPDAFLYYLAKAVILSSRARKRFSRLLIKNIQERLGTTIYPLDLAMRILAIKTLGFSMDKQLFAKIDTEKHQLEYLQKNDGSWPKDALYKAGRSNIFFGSREISTAFAVSALHALQICPIYQTGVQ